MTINHRGHGDFHGVGQRKFLITKDTEIYTILIVKKNLSDLCESLRVTLWLKRNSVVTSAVSIGLQGRWF